MEPIEAEIEHWIIRSEVQDVQYVDPTESWVKLACLSDYIRFPDCPFTRGDRIKLIIERKLNDKPSPPSIK